MSCPEGELNLNGVIYKISKGADGSITVKSESSGSTPVGQTGVPSANSRVVDKSTNQTPGLGQIQNVVEPVQSSITPDNKNSSSVTETSDNDIQINGEGNQTNAKIVNTDEKTGDIVDTAQETPKDETPVNTTKTNEQNTENKDGATPGGGRRRTRKNQQKKQQQEGGKRRAKKVKSMKKMSKRELIKMVKELQK